MSNIPQTLTIAGSDSGGGAGISSRFENLSNARCIWNLSDNCNNCTKHAWGI